MHGLVVSFPVLRSPGVVAVAQFVPVAADNGLMIGGLADTGRVLKEPRYVAAAEKAADFVLSKLRTAHLRVADNIRTGCTGRTTRGVPR